MIKSYKVNHLSPQEFIDKVMQYLHKGELGKMTTLSVANENMIMTFSKLGKSEFIYSLTKETDGFSCLHKTDKIAFAHKAFKNEVQKAVVKALEFAGATVVVD